MKLYFFLWRFTGVVFILLLCFIFSFFFLLELRRVSARKAHVGVLNYKADCGVFLMVGEGELKQGLSLLRQKGVRKLIISGVNSKEALNYILQHPFYKKLKPKDIILEFLSKNTYESAKQTEGLTQELQCKNLMLVTSHLHIYRAHKVFSNFFSEDYLIHTLAVKPRSARFSPDHYVIETFKSLYYSLWAY